MEQHHQKSSVHFSYGSLFRTSGKADTVAVSYSDTLMEREKCHCSQSIAGSSHPNLEASTLVLGAILLAASANS